MNKGTMEIIDFLDNLIVSKAACIVHYPVDKNMQVFDKI